jgi:hypothetical protein
MALRLAGQSAETQTTATPRERALICRCQSGIVQYVAADAGYLEFIPKPQRAVFVLPPWI